MGREAERLRTLIADLRAELALTERIVQELIGARQAIESRSLGQLEVYGAAALVNNFYTGVERALERIAKAMGELPAGDSWHQKLLANMAQPVPRIRPAIISPTTLQELDRYRAFRHRFRNLYLVQLEVALFQPLLADIASVWQQVSADFERFLTLLQTMVDELER